MNNFPRRRVLVGIILSFTFALTESGWDVVKNHCITNGGNEVNKPCVFPFWHDRGDGLHPYGYSFCTNTDSEKCWCYTEVDSNGVGVHGKWGYCGEVCSFEFVRTDYKSTVNGHNRTYSNIEKTKPEEPTMHPKRLSGQDAKMKDTDDESLRCNIKPFCTIYGGCYECTFKENCDNHCTLKENCNRFLKQQVEITIPVLESEDSEESSEELETTAPESEPTTTESETKTAKPCEDNDEEIRRLTYGVYKSCWLMVLSNNGKCKNSGEGIAPYAENCRLSCGQCKKDPKDMDIVDIIHSHKNLTTLAVAIANADFIPLLRSTKEDFTFFAPHNDAFNEDLINMITRNETGTFDLLSRHKVVGHGRFTTDKIDHGVLITVNNHGNGFIEILRNEKTDEITVVERPGSNPYATIVERDIPASNGVIHILDGVL